MFTTSFVTLEKSLAIDITSSDSFIPGIVISCRPLAALTTSGVNPKASSTPRSATVSSLSEPLKTPLTPLPASPKPASSGEMKRLTLPETLRKYWSGSILYLFTTVLNSSKLLNLTLSPLEFDFNML